MEDQIILVDKPAGISSFGAVAKVRKDLSQKLGHRVKVGHTGTLDPFATGLLIILTGTNTKKSNDFLKLDKVYEATLMLGATSTTGDPEGEITDWDSRPDSSLDLSGFPKDMLPFLHIQRVPTLQEVKDTLKSFTGTIKQQVPYYSAVKIDGVRAYKLARQGKTFDTPTREVTIYNIELLDYAYPELKIRTHVSSGTYIRTLAEDIGKKLDTGAYLTALRRLKVGDYDVKNARKI